MVSSGNVQLISSIRYASRFDPRKERVNGAPGRRLRFPGTLRDRWDEGIEALWRELQGLPALRTHVGRHQDLHHLDSVLERQHPLLAPQKSAREMPVLSKVSVSLRLIRYDGHEAHLGVLLFHQVFTRLPLASPTEKELEPAVQRVPRHRVLRAEELGGQPQPGADEAPRSRDLSYQRLA